MFFYTYILLILKDKGFYIRFTRNINRRLTQHNEGKSVSTKARRPFISSFANSQRGANISKFINIFNLMNPILNPRVKLSGICRVSLIFNSYLR